MDKIIIILTLLTTGHNLSTLPRVALGCWIKKSNKFEPVIIILISTYICAIILFLAKFQVLLSHIRFKNARIFQDVYV